MKKAQYAKFALSLLFFISPLFGMNQTDPASQLSESEKQKQKEELWQKAADKANLLVEYGKIPNDQRLYIQNREKNYAIIIDPNTNEVKLNETLYEPINQFQYIRKRPKETGDYEQLISIDLKNNKTWLTALKFTKNQLSDEYIIKLDDLVSKDSWKGLIAIDPKTGELSIDESRCALSVENVWEINLQDGSKIEISYLSGCSHQPSWNIKIKEVQTINWKPDGTLIVKLGKLGQAAFRSRCIHLIGTGNEMKNTTLWADEKVVNFGSLYLGIVLMLRLN